MKYEFIREQSSTYMVSELCKILEIKRAAYYQWQKRRASSRSIEEAKVYSSIMYYYTQSKGRYGLLNLTAAIRKDGQKVNKKRIYRIMKKYNIRSVTKRKFRITTKHDGKGRYSENLIKGNFQTVRSNQLWSSDITYIRTSEGWLYLAVVLDVYRRKIVGWSLSSRINAEIVREAINMALRHERPPVGVIFHSDRGSQYTSNMVRKLLAENGFKQSMSSTANCYDNAITETFFATLKKELVYQKKFTTREEAKNEIFEYIEIYYNRKRQHSSLNYLSPLVFENMIGIILKLERYF